MVFSDPDPSLTATTPHTTHHPTLTMTKHHQQQHPLHQHLHHRPQGTTATTSDTTNTANTTTNTTTTPCMVVWDEPKQPSSEHPKRFFVYCDAGRFAGGGCGL